MFLWEIKSHLPMFFAEYISQCVITWVIISRNKRTRNRSKYGANKSRSKFSLLTLFTYTLYNLKRQQKK